MGTVATPPPEAQQARGIAQYLAQYGTAGALIFLTVIGGIESKGWRDLHARYAHALHEVSELTPAVTDVPGGWAMSIPPQGFAARRIGVWWRLGQAEGWSMHDVPAEGDWTWTVTYPPGPTGSVVMRLYVEREDGADLFGRTFSRVRP